MAKWLKSLFFVFVLCGSVFSGTPLGEDGAKWVSCPTKCCKRQIESAKSQQADAANLCRAINCSNPSPTSATTSARVNLAPLLVILKNFPVFQFLFTPQPEEKAQPVFAAQTQLKSFQPKYIRNLSLLI